jgi:hypothetical protein
MWDVVRLRDDFFHRDRQIHVPGPAHLDGVANRGDGATREVLSILVVCFDKHRHEKLYRLVHGRNLGEITRAGEGASRGGRAKPPSVAQRLAAPEGRHLCRLLMPGTGPR